MLEQESAEFRKALQECERSASGHAPRELRVRGAKLVSQLLEGGECIAGVAKALGITAPTVKQWGGTTLATVRRAELTQAVVPVEVVEPPGRPSRPAAARVVSLVAPGGYRVEGLSLSEVATLLRALR